MSTDERMKLADELKYWIRVIGNRVGESRSFCDTADDIIAALRAPEAADAGAVAPVMIDEIATIWRLVHDESVTAEALGARVRKVWLALADSEPLRCLFCRGPAGDDLIVDDNGAVACKSCGEAEYAAQTRENAFPTAAGIAAPPAASADAVREQIVQIVAEAMDDKADSATHGYQGANELDEQRAQAAADGILAAIAALSAPVAGADAGMRERAGDQIDAAMKWPSGCHSPNSCDRHQQCMYLNCRYEGKDIKPDIAAAKATLSQRPNTGGEAIVDALSEVRVADTLDSMREHPQHPKLDATRS